MRTERLRILLQESIRSISPIRAGLEQNPQDWFHQSMEGIKELLAGYPKEEVAGISFGGQMHGLVVLDERDQVIRPAILWNDGRTGKETEYLNQVIGKRTAVRIHGKYCICRIYSPKISLDERT